LRNVDFQTFDLRLILLSSPMSKSNNNNISSQPPNLPTSKRVPRGFLPSTFRLSALELFITFNCSLLIFSCGLDIEDPTPPSPPVWVEKSLPEDWPERGIDAHESGGIFLEWISNSEDDIIAYEVFRATWYEIHDSLGNYSRHDKLETKSHPQPEYTDRDVTIGFKYIYKLKSVDASGNSSIFSDSISYALLSAINSVVVTPNGQDMPLPEDRTLRWWFPTLIEMENYCITILSDNEDLVCRSIIQPINYVGGWESWRIPGEIMFNPGSVYMWRVDMGAQYIDDRETHGSESEWAKFIYLNY
jgi:hypothetical protein